MATASIFRTPVIESERAVDSFIEAVASSEAARDARTDSERERHAREVGDERELAELLENLR